MLRYVKFFTNSISVCDVVKIMVLQQKKWKMTPKIHRFKLFYLKKIWNWYQTYICTFKFYKNISNSKFYFKRTVSHLKFNNKYLKKCQLFWLTVKSKLIDILKSLVLPCLAPSEYQRTPSGSYSCVQLLSLKRLISAFLHEKNWYKEPQQKLIKKLTLFVNKCGIHSSLKKYYERQETTSLCHEKMKNHLQSLLSQVSIFLPPLLRILVWFPFLSRSVI